MGKSESKNSRTLILGSGILVALYVILQLSIYLYHPRTVSTASVDSKPFNLPREATLLNAVMTYMASIVAIPKN